MCKRCLSVETINRYCTTCAEFIFEGYNVKEQDYQRKIVKLLESKGAYVVKVITASKKGVPDVIACYKGHFIAIEVKTPNTMNNVSPLQQYNLKTINDAGGYALVAWSINVVEEMMEMIDNES
jgi:Holliday junction resolvase